ncbi:MAG: heavy-metal-associated domain-containing protein [Clostridiales bacterium]|nr:heavy-metal-associated domain-containing protein [Clostridiales bacterium]
MKEYSFKVPSMHDETSAKEIVSIVNGIRGIQNVDVDYQEGTINVFYDENQVIEDKIRYTIEKKGFKVRD